MGNGETNSLAAPLGCTEILPAMFALAAKSSLCLHGASHRVPTITPRINFADTAMHLALDVRAGMEATIAYLLLPIARASRFDLRA